MSDGSWLRFKYSWIEIIKVLSDKEAGKLLKAIVRYINDEDMPVLTGAVKVAFAIIENDLTEDRKRIRRHKKAIERYGEAKVIRNSGDYSEWRTAVFERDDYTCQICGQHGGKLNAHHIERFADNPDKRLDIDNGITLCEKCHKKVHSKKSPIQ